MKIPSWLAAGMAVVGVSATACGAGDVASPGPNSDTSPPTPPATIAASPVDATAIAISWAPATDNVGVTGYTVRRAGAAPLEVGLITSYIDDGLAPATTYTYSVTAHDAAGNSSPNSVTASATTDGASAVVFPLRVVAGKRYLVDANGTPYLLHGDTGWSLIADLSLADAEVYLEDRRQRGFNAVLVNLLEHKFATNAPRNFNGDPPFTTPGDYATPNEAYFAHVDAVIAKAAAKGILLLLTPSYLGFDGGDEGWYQEMVANGTAKLRAYGRYLGQRYAGNSNILWVNGGDYNPPDKSLTRAIALGIAETAPNALQTAHGAPETAALEYWSGESWLKLDNLYTRDPVYQAALTEYGRPEQMPFVLIEGRYENDALPEGTAQRMRVQAYQALLSGASGQVFGNNPIWHFDGPGLSPTGTPATWEGWLGSPGAVSMTAVHGLFAPRAWWTLVPDLNNSFLTAGLGTPDLDRAVAAKAGNGSFAVVYVPTARTVTIDLAKLAGPRVTARWYDPANGAFASIAESPFSLASNPQLQAFTPPGANSSGSDSDWALLLESIP